jgi:NADPH:quinone reductase and related Zn-dependent oxidoreductases
MRAFTRNRYGGPEVLQLDKVEKPSLKDDHILVKVVANSINPADWHILRGEPYFARLKFGLLSPRERIPGADFSGIVEAVGSKVSWFKVGDRVFGSRLDGGAFAEFVSVPETVCAAMPSKTAFPEMSCLPIAGLTALQALIYEGKLQRGESVLINGSSGGVGHIAVQIAKIRGARVVAVCSSKNEEFVASLGADHVIAYDKESIHAHRGKYDLVVDTNGNLYHDDYCRMGHRGVVLGYTNLSHMMKLMLRKTLSNFPLSQFSADMNTEDLNTLAAWVQNGVLKVAIDKTFPFEETPQAISYIEAMRTRGKVVVLREGIW